jgi:hydrogenase maturation protein HypF
MALSCLVCDTDAGERTVSALLPGLAPAEISGLKHMIARKLRSPPTSSAGRLFDAVSAMLGLCSEVTYEGQAAIRLQAAASPDVCDAYPCEIREPVVDFGPMIRNIVADILARSDRARIAGMFHNTLAAAAADVCERIRAATGLGQVALSGGVFQNDLLLQRLTGLLRERNFEVYSHRLLPPNDACICLGQAAVALAQTARARQ